jgi:hypothetical protein
MYEKREKDYRYMGYKTVRPAFMEKCVTGNDKGLQKQAFEVA